MGKSALIIQFVQGIFVHDYTGLQEKAFTKQGKKGRLELLEVDGSPQAVEIYNYLTTIKSCIMGVATVTAYSVSDKKSFENAKGYLRTFKEKFGKHENAKQIIVATKCDCEMTREVSQLEGLQLAAECGHPFFETSSKIRTNVDELFEYIEEQLYATTLKVLVESKDKKICRLS